ncbi:hypothetical protein V8E53_012201 [Lactarius tabidus]
MIVLKIPLNRPPAHLPSNRSLVGFFLPCHLPFPALPRVPRAPSLRKEQPRSTGPPPLTRLDSVKWRVTCRISLFPSPAQCYTTVTQPPPFLVGVLQGEALEGIGNICALFSPPGTGSRPYEQVHVCVRRCENATERNNQALVRYRIRHQRYPCPELQCFPRCSENCRRASSPSDCTTRHLDHLLIRHGIRYLPVWSCHGTFCIPFSRISHEIFASESDLRAVEVSPQHEEPVTGVRLSLTHAFIQYTPTVYNRCDALPSPFVSSSSILVTCCRAPQSPH